MTTPKFHEIIAEARKKAGMSKAEVARIFSLPYSTYDGYEKGTRKTPPGVALCLLDFYGIRLENFDLSFARSVVPNFKPFETTEQIRARQDKAMMKYFSELNIDARKKIIDIVSDYTKIIEYTTPDPILVDPRDLEDAELERLPAERDDPNMYG